VNLAVKRSAGPGKRNAWCLTARGEQAVRVLAADGGDRAPELPAVNVEPVAFLSISRRDRAAAPRATVQGAAARHGSM
jgi:hypothetical protein